MAAVTSLSYKKTSAKKPRGSQRAMPLAISPRTAKWLTVLIVSTVFIIFSALKILDPDTLPIRSVKINGNYAHISHSELRQAMRPYVNGGFFSVSINALQDKLLQLPWVKSAEVRRIWPGTLIVNVQERRAIAKWGKLGLVARNGDVFYPAVHTFPQKLPMLSGPKEQAKLVYESYRKMSAVLDPLGLKISDMTLTPRQAWHLHLSNGVRLLLGRVDWMSRLARFARAYPVALKKNASKLDYVDLRYSNGMAVHWRQASSMHRRRHT